MYKKFVTQLFLCNMLLLMSWFCLGGVQINKAAAAPAFRAVSDEISKPKADRSFVLSKRASSGQRVVDYTVMEKEYKYDLQDADYEALLKIVQAEAGNEDLEGKMLVAGVVMNRVSSAAFPDSVTEVVMQKEKGVYQFSPVGNGTYQNTRASEETIEAVESGSHIVEEAAEALNSSVDVTNQTIKLINEIWTASTEQAAMIEQVNTGVDQISSVVQTNSATAEQSAASSEELNGQATALQNLTSKFVLKKR